MCNFRLYQNKPQAQVTTVTAQNKTFVARAPVATQRPAVVMPVPQNLAPSVQQDAKGVPAQRKTYLLGE